MAEIRTAQAPARSNVYTVLALAAALVLIAGIVFVVLESKELTGESNPWKLLPEATSQVIELPQAFDPMTV